MIFTNCVSKPTPFFGPVKVLCKMYFSSGIKVFRMDHCFVPIPCSHSEIKHEIFVYLYIPFVGQESAEQLKNFVSWIFYFLQKSYEEFVSFAHPDRLRVIDAQLFPLFRKTCIKLLVKEPMSNSFIILALSWQKTRCPSFIRKLWKLLIFYFGK